MLDIKQTIIPLWINFQSDLKELLQKRKKRTTTKMKKSLAIIALTILTLISAFAAEVGSTSTKVTLSLQREAQYAYGVTTAELTETTAKSFSTTGISLVRDENSETFKMAQDYYVSYMFYEYENVSLTITTDGNLRDTQDVTQQIPFKVTMAAGKDNVVKSINPSATQTDTNKVEIYSNGKDTEGNKTNTIVSYTTATSVIGDYVYASLPLTVSATESDPLKGMNKNDTYTANIILTVISNN